MTFLSRLHPYPAMIADPLAQEMCDLFVSPGQRVLDPFCGTGRTLVAAMERGANGVGIDVNPLAVLVTSAKAGRIRVSDLVALESIVTRIDVGNAKEAEYSFAAERRVVWFSRKAQRELSALIRCLNECKLSRSSWLIAACILSATAREVSFCRDDQWKLHRMSAGERSAFKKSAHRVFLRRLRAIVEEVRSVNGYAGYGRIKAFRGNAMTLSGALRTAKEPTGFDLIFTSPPYGDSLSTVQYGGISSLCLEVLQHLKGGDRFSLHKARIDQSCLGGRSIDRPPGSEPFHVRRFWSGPEGTSAARKVGCFLADYSKSCAEIVGAMRPGSHAIYVVGRRSVADTELRLDRFTEQSMRRAGCVVVSRRKRTIVGKMTPYSVCRKARCARDKNVSSMQSNTMREEYVLVFEKPVHRRTRRGY